MKVLRTIVLLGLVVVVEVAISVIGMLAAVTLITTGGRVGWLLCPPVVVGTAFLAVRVKIALCAAFFPREEAVKHGT